MALEVLKSWTKHCIKQGVKMSFSITDTQFEELQGFMFHCWTVYHDNAKEYFDFWAKRLDEAKIPWHIQNTAAYLMNDRENGFRYFRDLLASKDIKVVLA